MPELACSLRVGPAISEPVQLDDERILVACETPERDAIHVYSLHLPEVGTLAIAHPIHELPGGPTDNGTRAMWPRATENGDEEFVCAYQQGERNVIAGITFPHELADIGRSFGVWPVGVDRSGGAWQAPPATSQGIFGYFAGRWWTYDKMRESVFQQDWLKLGTLSHAWTDTLSDGRGGHADRYLFKHESGTLLRTQSLAAGNRVDRVFDGYAEYPRGCTLQDGRILVTAVGPRVREVSPGVWEHQLRVAVSPFEKFEEETKPMAKVSIEGYTAGGIAPFACGFSYKTENAVRAWKRVRPVGDLTWQEEAVDPQGVFGFVVLANPGDYELSMRAEGVDGVSAETGMRRVITVLAPPAPEPPPVTPPQVITRADVDALTAEYDRVRNTALTSALSYDNARCAGQSHDEAMQTYREAVIAAIRGGQ